MEQVLEQGLRRRPQRRRPQGVETDPALVRPVETPPLIGSAARLHEHTGWTPEHTLADTLAAVLDAARAAG